MAEAHLTKYALRRRSSLFFAFLGQQETQDELHVSFFLASQPLPLIPPGARIVP